MVQPLSRQSHVVVPAQSKKQKTNKQQKQFKRTSLQKKDSKKGPKCISSQLDMHHKRKTTVLLSTPKSTETNTNTVTARWTGGGSRHIWVGKEGAGLNFTRFADSRKGGGNAMG